MVLQKYILLNSDVHAYISEFFLNQRALQSCDFGNTGSGYITLQIINIAKYLKRSSKMSRQPVVWAKVCPASVIAQRHKDYKSLFHKSKATHKTKIENVM